MFDLVNLNLSAIYVRLPIGSYSLVHVPWYMFLGSCSLVHVPWLCFGVGFEGVGFEGVGFEGVGFEGVGFFIRFAEDLSEGCIVKRGGV